MLNRSKHRKHFVPKPKRIVIPEYPIPTELNDILDTNLKMCPATSETSHNYVKILKVLRNVEHLDITEAHYFQLMKLALYLEGIQADKDMQNETQTYTSVRDVDERLQDIRKRKKLCDNNFQNYPLRCAHYALGLTLRESTITYLFPHESKSFIANEVYDFSDLQMTYRNSDIASNAEQRQAITNIVNKSSFPLPYILYGPPGTGKTATLVETLCQIHNRDPFSHILVCTPSNTAADEITRRLLDYLSADSVYRMYSQSKEGSAIDKKMQSCANIKNDKILLLEREELMQKRIVITTLCNSIRLIIMRIPFYHFSHVIIDEAGQATEPDMLIPMSLVSRNGSLYSQIVLAGDPHQLGPTVNSKLAYSILGRSILERLMSYNIYKKDINDKYTPRYITMLLENYRSHPDILHVPNKLFYENELIAKVLKNNDKERFPPIIFHGFEGTEEKNPLSHSVCNSQEVKLVVGYVDALLKDRMGFGALTVEDIGIVTPFTFQSEKIQGALKERKVEGINVGTVELFQGQERDAMIMTTVRSKTFRHEGKEHIGHLSNPKRFNVAITRAKKLLIIVGNPNVLQLDKNWRYLLKFCINNKFYKGMKFELNNSIDEESDVNSNIVKSSGLFGECSLPLYAD